MLVLTKGTTMIKRKLGMLVCLLVVALLAAACGDDDGSSSAADDTTTTTAAADDAPDEGDGDEGDGSDAANLHELLPERIRNAGYMTWAGDLQAPLRMLDADGSTLIGLQADFAAALEELLGVEIRQETVDGFAAMKTGLESGRFDFVFGPLADSAAAQETLDIVTWILATPAFLFPAGDDVTDTLDFCGKPLARVAGSVPMTAAFDTLSEECVANGLEPVEALEFADRAATQLAVLSGRAAGTGTTPADAAYTAQERSEEFSFIIGEQDRFVVSYLGFATRKDDTELRDAMLAAMQQLFDDGTYASIMSSYSLDEVMVDEPILNRATQ